MKRFLSLLLVLSMAFGLSAVGKAWADGEKPGPDNATIDAAIYLDYAAGIKAGVYRWVPSDDGSYYTLAAVDESGEPLTAQESAINVGANNEERGGMGGFPGGELPEGFQPPAGMAMGPGGMGGSGGGGTVYQGVYMNANITNAENQTMLIYAPAAYFTVDENGEVTGINHETSVGSYTADTAPIVYLNECGGWKSSSPRAVDTSYLEQGMIYVTAGARSRDAELVDAYITDALTGEKADTIYEQANLLNATEILLGSDGHSAVDPALYWRDRSGTADQHTSFSVGYNILLAAQMLGRDVDYHLVWNMGHGSNEGTSTGTFIDWINEICA